MFNKKQLIITILKNFLVAVAAIVLAVIIVFLTSRQISKISQAIDKQRINAFILEKRNETVSQLREDFKIIGDADKKIEEALPPTNDILGFVAGLENLASQNSFQQALSFSVLSSNKLDYSISLNGNIFNFINYLKDFEKAPFFTEISSINIQSQNGWENISSFSLKAKVHIRQSQ